MQYYRDFENNSNNNNIIDFPADKNISILFKFKEKITGQIGNNGTKEVDKMVLLKYIRNFWTTLEMSLINCKISLTLSWSKQCFSVTDTTVNQDPIFAITDTNFYVLVVTLLTQGRSRLNIYKNWYKTLCSICNFINSRQSKIQYLQ